MHQQHQPEWKIPPLEHIRNRKKKVQKILTPKRSDPFFRSCNRWRDSIFIFLLISFFLVSFFLHSMNHLTFYEITFMPPLFIPILNGWSSLPIFWLILNIMAFYSEQKNYCWGRWGARVLIYRKKNYNSAREKNGNLIFTKGKWKQFLWCWFFSILLLSLNSFVVGAFLLWCPPLKFSSSKLCVPFFIM